MADCCVMRDTKKKKKKTPCFFVETKINHKELITETFQKNRSAISRSTQTIQVVYSFYLYYILGAKV